MSGVFVDTYTDTTQCCKPKAAMKFITAWTLTENNIVSSKAAVVLKVFLLSVAFILRFVFTCFTAKSKLSDQFSHKIHNLISTVSLLIGDKKVYAYCVDRRKTHARGILVLM